MGTQGKVTDPAATPFASRDGKAINPPEGTARGTDFTANPSGQGAQNAQAYVPPQRPQRDEPIEGTPPQRVHMQQVPQPPRVGTFGPGRANPADAGRDGGMPILDSAATLARGGPQGAHNPMKLGTPGVAPPPNPSGSGTRTSSASSASNPMTAWPSRSSTSSSDSKVRETDAIPKHRK